MNKVKEVRARIGRNLRRLRTAKHLTQEALGYLADSTAAYISEVENGRRTPKLEPLCRLADQLGVDVSELLKQD